MVVPSRFFGQRCFVVLAVAFALFLFLSTARILHVSIAASSPEEAWKDPKFYPVCSLPELQTLKNSKVKLGREFNYVRRCINPRYDDSISRYDRGDGLFVDTVVNVSRPLIMDKVTVNMEACDPIESIPCEPIELPMQRPYREMRHDQFIFGVATTYKRLEESKAMFRHWLSNSGAPLIALIVDEPGDGRPRKSDLGKRLVRDYADAGITLKIVEPPDGSPTQLHPHAMMIVDMLDYIDGEGDRSAARWLGIVDNDTFFPSLSALRQAFSPFDPLVPTYLGAGTEYDELNNTVIKKAFHGAGTFLSVPLARQIAPHLESCSGHHGGDMQIMDCVHNHTQARLTHVQGLQQQDLRGDVSGFYESGWRLLSLHHWNSWYEAPVAQMAAVVPLCGDCFLQRYAFSDNAVLANGYSVSVYPNGLPDLTRMEATWEDAAHASAPDGEVSQSSLGPLREKMSDTDKLSYRLVDAYITPDWDFRQIFVRRGDSEKQEVDEVIDLLWRLQWQLES
ncbi:hypothetical protein VTN31DRAFT_3943 [Thermomyces dupontii]|uniref:uncharacterized protein n=1 Tax=Talaromyces thermophilus TaxID=28565 RepID=UPI0037430D53